MDMAYIKRTHIYKQEKRYSLELDVYLPENVDKNIAVVIYLHGGALIFGNRNMINKSELAAVLSEKMAYISVDYRLAPETKLMNIKEDIEDAIVWVREEGARLYNFDSNRIAVLGKSAGGYLALLSGTLQNKPNAIISFYGYGDILGDWYSKPSPHYLKYPLITEEESSKCIQSGLPTGSDFEERFPLYLRSRQTGTWVSLVSGYDAFKDETVLSSYCPIITVHSEFPPTFLLHGSADTDVPVDQSKDMYTALMNAGIKAKLFIAPNAEHGFDSVWNNTSEEFGQVIYFLKELCFKEELV